jgi:predicted Holliday junction resolvase-like endonuclease
MRNYTNLFKNILLIIFLIAILKLYNEKNELRSINHKILKRQRRQSELLVNKKLNEIDSLKQNIKREQYLINEALIVINDLQNQKTKVEKVYVEKVTEINTYDANQLKNYFNEELK